MPRENVWKETHHTFNNVSFMGDCGRGSVNGGTLTRKLMTSILIEYFIEYLSFCH